MEISFQLSPNVIELGLKLENQVKAFFVKDEGMNLIFNYSFDAASPISIVYRAICSTVDSPFSPENFVSDLGIFQTLGISACWI